MHAIYSPKTPLKALILVVSLVVSLAFITMAKSYAIGPAEAISAYGDTATYTIERNGKKIGKHTVSFANDAQGLTVNIVSDIKVRVLKIPVYSFYYESTEQWTDDRLQSIKSTVTEKGKTVTTQYQFNDGTATMTDTEGQQTTGEVNFGSNHWNNGVVNEQQLFNTLTGRANRVTVSAPQSERLIIGGKEIDTTHYIYSDELQAEVWYDSVGRWVQLLFKGEDGSVIKYISDGFDA